MMSDRNAFSPAAVAMLCGCAFAALATPAHAGKRERVWDTRQTCPTEAPVLVGSAGAAGRFSALSGCADVRVVPQATPDQVAVSDDGSAIEGDSGFGYVVRGTRRTDDGQLGDGVRSAGYGDDAATARAGDVRVSRTQTAAGVPVVTIAPLADPDAAAASARPVGVPVTVARQAAPAAPLAQPAVIAAPPTEDAILDLRPDRVTPFDHEVATVARRQRIDPLLLHAVIRRESGYRARIVSHAGAVGAMQVMPGTGRMLGVQPHSLTHPMTNIEAGARLLRRLATRYQNDFRLVLAAYNAGEGAVAKYGNRVPPYAETQHYVRAVMDEYARLAASAGLRLAKGN